MEINKIYKGDSLSVLKTLPDESINCVVTSPPYWGLRDYGVSGQIGLEESFGEYISNLCDIFDEIKRVLTKDGTCWVNLGDTYNTTQARNKEFKDNNRTRIKNTDLINYNRQIGLTKSIPKKCLLQIPSRFAIEMVNRGWILRNEIIWHKPNCMPAAVKDRFTVDFEKMFFFTKSTKYQFKQQLEPWTNTNKSDTKRAGKFIKYNGKHKEDSGNKGVVVGDPEKGRNKRTVWKITTKPYKEAHFAVFPEDLIETPIDSGCPENGIVLDPFMGSGTTGVVTKKQGKNYVGIELNEEYIKIAEERIKNISC